MQDARAHRRLEAPLVLDYQVYGGNQGSTVVCNVSCGGIRFGVRERLALGTQIELLLRPDLKERPIQCRGMVVWCHTADRLSGPPYEVGLQLTQVDPIDADRLVQAAYAYWELIAR